MTMRVNLAIVCSFLPQVLACSGVCNQTYAEDMPCYTELYRVEYLDCFHNYAGKLRTNFARHAQLLSTVESQAAEGLHSLEVRGFGCYHWLQERTSCWVSLSESDEL